MMMRHLFFTKSISAISSHKTCQEWNDRFP